MTNDFEDGYEAGRAEEGQRIRKLVEKKRIVAVPPLPNGKFAVYKHAYNEALTDILSSLEESK